MKKISIFSWLSILLFFSCTGPKEQMQEVYHTGVDFIKYTKNNFLITPEQYLGEYESIGLLNTIMYPEIRKVDYRTLINDPSYQRWDEGWSIKKLDLNVALDSMYHQAVRMGADAISRFNISHVSKINGNKYVDGVELSGLAIKRK